MVAIRPSDTFCLMPLKNKILAQLSILFFDNGMGIMAEKHIVQTLKQISLDKIDLVRGTIPV